MVCYSVALEIYCSLLSWLHEIKDGPDKANMPKLVGSANLLAFPRKCLTRTSFTPAVVVVTSLDTKILVLLVSVAPIYLFFDSEADDVVGNSNQF